MFSKKQAHNLYHVVQLGKWAAQHERNGVRGLQLAKDFLKASKPMFTKFFNWIK